MSLVVSAVRYKRLIKVSSRRPRLIYTMIRSYLFTNGSLHSLPIERWLALKAALYVRPHVVLQASHVPHTAEIGRRPAAFPSFTVNGHGSHIKPLSRPEGAEWLSAAVIAKEAHGAAVKVVDLDPF